ncbi:MAG: glycosyltransferase [Deltaproteobacteria bacterium]|jgi:adsorption protein B|nr:glycosyltransferase [Deltaproteobacteria bacterium]
MSLPLSGEFFAVEFFPVVGLLLLAALLAVDDLFIDLMSAIKRLRPKAVGKDELRSWRQQSQKNIAVVVANWHEEDVIERMLRGNLSRLEYARVWFFVGVYPNDEATVEAARRAARNDSRVVVVENPVPGPTTKGQMLNVIFRRTFEVESRIGSQFDIFLMHDSEDVLHPQSLLMINAEMTSGFDFVQIPVFSFARKASMIVGSTYIDEFAEIHTKDLLVRDYLKAGIPSAGVGTAISRRLVQNLMSTQHGSVLNETSLTEDYILGLTTAHLGYRSKFVSRYIPHYDRNGKLVRREFIATREYFPSEWGRAVRQKGRWIHGIVLQGRRLLKFEGSPARRYFLMRDRKGPVTAIVGVLGVMVLLGNLLLRTFAPDVYETQILPLFSSPIIVSLFGFNLMAGTFRAAQRGYAVWLTQDMATACLSLFRIPVGNFLNFAAVLRAISQDRVARSTGAAPKWTKTIHELPADFGLEQPAQAEEPSKQVQL